MKLFFRRYGEGPSLVILHGLYGSSDNWVTIAKRISSYFTVYLPDQRNHGNSPHSRVHDYNSMADDLLELAVDQKLNRFFLAGHSMGGKTAALFAIRWPEMVCGLAVADIAPFSGDARKQAGYDYHYAILKTLKDVDLSHALSRSDADTLLAEKIRDNNLKGFLLKNLKRDDGNRFYWKINVNALLANLDKITRPLLTTDSQPVTGFPVMLLKGEKSDYIKESDFRDMLRIFPSAELRIIKNTGHWLHADNPAEVCNALISLLDS